MARERFKELSNVFRDVDCDTAQSTTVDCRGFSTILSVGIPVGLTDGGGIDQDITLEGSVDGVLWTSLVDPYITFTGAATSIQATIKDIRGYSQLRFVYDQKGATAGTFSLWVNLIEDNLAAIV